jgi:hypothetical protein
LTAAAAEFTLEATGAPVDPRYARGGGVSFGSYGQIQIIHIGGNTRTERMLNRGSAFRRGNRDPNAESDPNGAFSDFCAHPINYTNANHRTLASEQ